MAFNGVANAHGPSPQPTYMQVSIMHVFVGWAISRCLSTAPHLMVGQEDSILLVHYSMIILKPAIWYLMAVVRYNHIVICNYHSMHVLECFTFENLI